VGGQQVGGWLRANQSERYEVAGAAAQPRAARRGVSRGQALVEFALVAPIFFLLIFGVIEFSLINASVGAYNFAAKDAARLGATRGPTDANIDQEIIALVNSHVSGVPAATTLEIDIFQADSTGAPIAGALDAYTPAGVPIGSPTWPCNDRNDGQPLPSGVNSSPYLGVRVTYDYTYVTALLSSGAPVIKLVTTAVFRIEPQESTGDIAPIAQAQSARDAALTAPALPSGVVALSAPGMIVPSRREASR